MNSLQSGRMNGTQGNNGKYVSWPILAALSYSLGANALKYHQIRGAGGRWRVGGGATVWITALGAAAAAASPHGCVLNLLRFIHTQSSYWLLEVAALAPWTQ